MEEPFRKDLSHLSWDEVFARQKLRADLVGDWMEALRLKPGDRVLDVGAGPGYVSLVLAERVGAAGVVYALDRSPDALAHLERLQEERGLAQIRRLVADAASLEPSGLEAGSALIAMVLHHANNPAGILMSVARLLPPGALALVAEFDPEGPCEIGPPRAHRIRPEQIQAWAEGAGFSLVSSRSQTPEHYMMLFQRHEPASRSAR